MNWSWWKPGKNKFSVFGRSSQCWSVKFWSKIKIKRFKKWFSKIRLGRWFFLENYLRMVYEGYFWFKKFIRISSLIDKINNTKTNQKSAIFTILSFQGTRNLREKLDKDCGFKLRSFEYYFSFVEMTKSMWALFKV